MVTNKIPPTSMIRNAFFGLLLGFLTLQLLHAQTPVSGGIYANTTWSLANSPYLMTGPVVVFPGKTLTIEPGVEVRVAYGGIPNTGLMHYLEIRGSLIAVGTLTNPIVFKSDTLPTEFTWIGINVKATQGGQIAMDYFELENAFNGIHSDQQGAPTLEFHHCKFRYNNYAVQPFGPINFYDCTFQFNGQAIGSSWQLNYPILLNRCEFSNNSSCNGFQTDITVDSCVVRDNMNGIWYTASPISNTLFERNTYAIYGVTSSISNCVFTNNVLGLMDFLGAADNCFFSGNGLAAEMGSGGQLTNSSLQNDTIAIAYSASLAANLPNPVVLQNRICGSVDYYIENKSDRNFALDQNCFCETDSTIIEGLIFDGYDDFTRGLFNYAIYDSTCTTVLQYVTKVNLPTSTEPAANAGFTLYPVPAGDQLFLAVPSYLVGGSLTAGLYDAQGRQIGEGRRLDSQQLSWDLSQLAAGMYFVRVTGEKPVTLRFVK